MLLARCESWSVSQCEFTKPVPLLILFSTSYGFVFFKNGQWIDVVIDDILAVKVAPWDKLNPSEKAIYHDNRDGYNNIARRGSKILSFAAAVEEGVTLL